MSRYHRENPDQPIQHDCFEGVQIHDEKMTPESLTETELWNPEEDMKILNFHVGAASSVFYRMLRRFKEQAIHPPSDPSIP